VTESLLIGTASLALCTPGAGHERRRQDMEEAVIAIVREPSQALSGCALTYLSREKIDGERAILQHREYQHRLKELGVEVLSLPPLPNLPDSTFVEDPAIVLDEIAILPIMGLAARRPEVDHIAPTLGRYRELRRLSKPSTLDGGDVICVGRNIFVGLSQRTNREAIEQMQTLVKPFGYTVTPVEVRGCLHLKTGCTYLGDSTMLFNPKYVAADALLDFRTIPVDDSEPMGANALAVGQKVMYPDCFAETRQKIEKSGFHVIPVCISELQKAEAGLTCMAVIF